MLTNALAMPLDAPECMADARRVAPLPDMQLCSLCEMLHVGYYRASGEFVCCECWGTYIEAGLAVGEPYDE